MSKLIRCHGLRAELRDELLTKIKTDMNNVKEAMIREFVDHALTCPDPIGCEVRAWQALFSEEQDI